MTPERTARDLLARLGRGAVPVEPEASSVEMRQRLVPRIDDMIRRRARPPRARARRRRWVWAATASLAFSMTALALSVVRSSGAEIPLAQLVVDTGRVQVWSGEGPLTLVDSTTSRLATGNELTVGAQSAGRIVLGGVSVTLTGATRVRLDDDTPAHRVVHLAEGRVSVSVPKLDAGESFAVTTPDCVVTVHGTAFTVEVAKGTRVAVSSGIVVVEHGPAIVTLRAGDEWSSLPPTARVEADAPPEKEHQSAESVASGEGGLVAASLVASPAPTPVAATRPRRESRPAVGAATGSLSHEPGAAGVAPPTGAVARPSAAFDPEPSPTDDLALQNAIFRDALAARRAGRPHVALVLFRRLLRQYPQSPIAHEARVEEMRLVRESGDGESAAAVGKRYLELHPTGFAADEARGIAAPSR